MWRMGFSWGSGLVALWHVASDKASACSAGNARDEGSVHGSGRCPGGGRGNPLQCSYLENPMDRETWQAIAREVTKTRTRLSIDAHMWDLGSLTRG